MEFKIRLQLSFLFFLEFFIWGAWFVTMGTFLSQEFSASGGQLAMAYETQSIGAIIAPFIIGLIADRYFSAQKIDRMKKETKKPKDFIKMQAENRNLEKDFERFMGQNLAEA